MAACPATGDDRDIYWESEGSRLAMTITALGLALLIIKYRQRIYGDDKGTGLIADAEPETRALLVEFGMDAGLLSDCEEITALVMRTKNEVCKISQLWHDAEQQKKREELLEEEEEDKDRRLRWRDESTREQVDTHPLGEFVKDKRILIPVTVAEDKKSKAGQVEDGGTPDKPATKVRAWTLYKRWQDALAPVMQRFIEAGREAALYKRSQRFRDVFERNIAQAVKHTDFKRIRDEVLANIGQAVLHPLDDTSIRPAPNMLALAQTVLQSFFKVTRREYDSKRKNTLAHRISKTSPPCGWLSC